MQAAGVEFDPLAVILQRARHFGHNGGRFAQRFAIFFELFVEAREVGEGARGLRYLIQRRRLVARGFVEDVVGFLGIHRQRLGVGKASVFFRKRRLLVWLEPRRANLLKLELEHVHAARPFARGVDELL